MKGELKHLLGIKGLEKEQVLALLDSADQFVDVNKRAVKKVPALRGKTVVNMFFEASTRTRMSFELAGKRLSADVINFGASSSSTSKGESLIDTALTIQSMAPDVVVMRHPASGACKLVADHLPGTSVVNAGDGLHEHPTQALLDALCIRRRLGTLENLSVSFVGDALRSRVVRSNIYLLKLFGCRVRLVAPPTLAVSEFIGMGAEVFPDMKRGIEGADVVVSLRMKHEYQKDIYIPSLEEYSRLYCITEERLRDYAPDCIVLAPGPIIRGTEIASDVADGPRSHIEEQVELGVAVRMAVLFLLATGAENKGRDSSSEDGIKELVANEQ